MMHKRGNRLHWTNQAKMLKIWKWKQAKKTQREGPVSIDQPRGATICYLKISIFPQRNYKTCQQTGISDITEGQSKQ